MRPLSDTLARLAAMKARTAVPVSRSGPSRLVPFPFSGPNPGHLGVKAYIPSGAAPGAALVVVLHGCTQTADGYDHGSGWSTLAEEHGFFLLFPEQQRANNPNLCFNWFQPEHTQRGSGEAASIRGMIEAMSRAHAIDPRRVFITGLSAGGAMAATMLAAYPEVFAGGAIIAGLAHGVANGVPEAFDRMRGHALPSQGELQGALRNASPHGGPWPTVSIWQGTADNTVHATNANAIVDQWLEVHALERTPSARRTLGGRTTSEWSSRDGVVKVTQHRIDGMGHGTPLASSGPAAYGHPGPYMLDVGIGSTHEIAVAWSLTDGVRSQPAKQTGAVSGDEYVRSDVMPEPVQSGERASAGADAAPGKVGEIIEAALRSAGLMK
ncbi:PHB depolymerase family esterase [Kaistia defluvii]|uniref:extracellular catalytic domain type 1 short-chain-length polyhydroxyalkanoate depolymerase n=1 Tax=Kaistia defluvii TaxID=410841 RepID=UPI0022524E5A|nr:PHB depolymerase family esterase [Kaistia defluvii]MCX5518108.1 PHB depolymerase family esterase [Kaistia defluvii]